jgi:hypothetical protein
VTRRSGSWNHDHVPVRRRYDLALACLPLLLVAALFGGSSSAVAAPAVGAASPLNGREYVALGDSFTAAWGVNPVNPNQPSSGCIQSLNDYPHQVAANLGLRLTDVSCAGALTTNMTQAQTTFPDGKSHPPAPPQFDALTATTQIVTIGIGGNDFGFGEIAGACAVNPLTGYVFGDGWSGWYASCQDYYDPGGQPAADTLSQRITQVVGPAVEQTVAAIKAKSPQAAVFFVDYLALSTDKAHAPNPATYPGSCYLSLLYSQAFPFGAADTQYIAALEVLFNQTVDAAATKAGATVVSPFAKSLTHSPCAGTPDPWVNGITTQLTSTPPTTGSPTGAPPRPTATPTGSPQSSRLGSSDVRVGSLHPNLEGAIQQAESVTATILQTLGGAPGLAGAAAIAPLDAATAAAEGTVGRNVAGALVLALLVLGGTYLVLRRRRPTGS